MTKYIWGDADTQFFYELTPDVVLDAIESVGLKTTGRCIPLNSMENRVYEIEIEVPEESIKSASDNYVVAKFYRPGRWSFDQILDEHTFMQDLIKSEVPVVAPLSFDGISVFELKEHKLFFTIFPKKGGRVPDEMNEEQLQIMGRMLARLHNVGVTQKSKHRIEINTKSFGENNMRFLLEENFIPIHLKESFIQISTDLFKTINPLFDNIAVHRIHGDCHLGNIIWRSNEGPFFIDFDDMLMGPAIQDIWLIVPGIDQRAKEDRLILLEAYETMRDFDYRSLKLIEPLRALRYIHFAAWIAKRWDDNSFKQAFPQFENGHYFDILLNDLRTQLQLIKNDNILQSGEYY